MKPAVERGHLFLILALALLVRLPDLPYHFVDWDEGAMMSQAWAMTQGQALYRDIFQIHPLLGIVIFYPFFSLLSPEVAPHAVKALNLLLVGAMGILVYRIASSWLRNGTLSLLSACLFVFYLGRSWALSSYGAFYALLPILLSVYFLFCRRDPSGRIYVLCGALWGTAFFLFQGTAFDITAMVVCLAYVHRKSLRPALVHGFCLLLGFSGVTAAVSLYFVSQGTFHEAVESTLLRPILGYARLGPGKTRATEMLHARIRLVQTFAREILAWFSLQLFTILAGISWIVLDRRERIRSVQSAVPSGEDEGRDRLLFWGCLVWLAADFLGLFATGRFRDHSLLPFVAWFTLAGMFWVRRLDPSSRATLVAGVLTALVVLPTCHFAVSAWQEGLTPPLVRRSQEIARFIRAHTRKEDRIFLYRFHGTDVFYLSERLSANGIYEYVDMCEEHIKDLELAATKRKELLERPPAAIVLDPQVPVAPCEGTEEFFEKLIRGNYVRETVVMGSEVYLRKDGAEGLMTPEGRSGPSAPGP